MGYSHSWYRIGEIDRKVMDKIREDFALILREIPEESQIIDTPDFWGEPDDIAFGGVKGTCEPMVFSRVSQARQITPERARESWMKGRFFEYCKTEQLPYDLAVKVLLAIAKVHLGDDIRIFSDGQEDEWKEALKLIHSIGSYSSDLSIVDRELVIKE